MAKNSSKPAPKHFDLTSFADLLPSRSPVLGEDPTDYGGFHDGLISSLAPLSPYECVVAENLISIEWEIIQRRNLRDHALRTDIAKMLQKAVSNRQIGPFGQKLGDVEDPKQLANILISRAVSDDPGVRELAYEGIADLGLQPVDLLSEAYSNYINIRNHAAQHDQKLQELERRRREVKKDYDALQRARPINGDVLDG